MKFMEEFKTSDFLALVVIFNTSLAILVPIFFATYFTPFPDSIDLEKKIQTLRGELRSTLWGVLTTSLIALGLMPVVTFLDRLSKEKRILFLLIFVLLLSISVYNTFRAYDFIWKSTAISITRQVSETINVVDVVK